MRAFLIMMTSLLPTHTFAGQLHFSTGRSIECETIILTKQFAYCAGEQTRRYPLHFVTFASGKVFDERRSKGYVGKGRRVLGYIHGEVKTVHTIMRTDTKYVPTLVYPEYPIYRDYRYYPAVVPYNHFTYGSFKGSGRFRSTGRSTFRPAIRTTPNRARSIGVKGPRHIRSRITPPSAAPRKN